VTTKTHCLVDGFGRPLVIVVTPGQSHDCPALLPMLAELRVPRVGPGRPRTRPDKLLADKAYSSRAVRVHLRAQKVIAVIPDKADQIAHRQHRGSNGGRPPVFDAHEYKNRNVIERAINVFKNWRGIATRYDKLALVYRAGLVLAAITMWLR
jgi:putative transposase